MFKVKVTAYKKGMLHIGVLEGILHLIRLNLAWLWVALDMYLYRCFRLKINTAFFKSAQWMDRIRTGHQHQLQLTPQIFFTYPHPSRGMWHSKLKNYVNHAQANIFVPIELLQETQANIEDNQIQISTGGAQRYKRKKYSNVDIGLSTLEHQFLPT